MARLIDTGPQVEGGASRASVTIQPLTRVDSSMLQRLITGYETDEIYRVTTSETDALTSFDLRLTPAPQRLVKRYDHQDETTMQRYAALAQAGPGGGP